MRLFLKNLVFTILVPGTVAVYSIRLGTTICTCPAPGACWPPLRFGRRSGDLNNKGPHLIKLHP